MKFQLSPHSRAVGQAVFVVMLWATSWVLIKIGLGSIPALTFAGLRYMLAFLVLAAFALRPQRIATIRAFDRATWLRLFGLGVLLYALTQGASFVALSLLTAITTNMLWSFSTLAAAILGIVFLREIPRPLQWAGMVVYLAGVMVYFWPAAFSADQVLGVIVAGIGVLANAFAGVLGRRVNRVGDLDPLTITLVSMGIGGALLLGVGAAVQGVPRFGWQEWLIIAWLAVVNTAFAFTLWNHTLRTLSVMESSLINSLMLAFIPLLALLFLGEGLTPKEGVGLLLAGVGIVVVQLKRPAPAIAEQ